MRKLWRRLVGAANGLPADVAAWRDAWARAAAEAVVDARALEQLRSRLPRLSTDDDLEIEQEMLDGLQRAVDLASAIAERGLPTVATGHRVVGADTVHLVAPASMPDDPAQPSGQLSLTNARAIFVGGGRGFTAPWHALTRPAHADRDLLLIRVDGATLYRFRCNSYGDVLSAAIIARHLSKR